jgi:hypothetical protein
MDCDRMIAGTNKGTLVPVATVNGLVFTKPSDSKFAKKTYDGYIDLKAKLNAKADEYVKAAMEETGWTQKDRAVQWLLTPGR